jgi:hypothetical protein
LIFFKFFLNNNYIRNRSYKLHYYATYYFHFQNNSLK